jgi:hypothetical protein
LVVNQKCLKDSHDNITSLGQVYTFGHITGGIVVSLQRAPGYDESDASYKKDSSDDETCLYLLVILKVSIESSHFVNFLKVSKLEKKKKKKRDVHYQY